jgi:iron complex outermembrane receptor protein
LSQISNNFTINLHMWGNIMYKFVKFSLLAVASVGLSLSSFAQDTDQNDEDEVEEQIEVVEEVTVTGSRIKTTNTFDSPVPVTVVDGSEFENRLFDYASSAVTRLPQSAGTGVGPIGSSGVDNLRLGSQRTLVTVNGNRFVSSNGSGGGQVDINNIPTLLIDRVEVINIGGAAVYGSDAVGGVVNYVLKEDFEGFKFQYNHNNIFEDVDLQRGYKMLFGGNIMDGRGNLTFSLDYTTTGGVKVLDLPEDVKCKDYSSDSDGSGGNYVFPDCESFTYFGISPNGTVSFGDRANIPGYQGRNVNGYNVYWYEPTGRPVNLPLAWPGAAQSSHVGFDDNGNLRAYVQGIPTDGQARFRGGDGMNFGLKHDPAAYTIPIEKYNYVTTGRFDVTPRMRVSGSVYVTSYESIDEATQGFYNTSFFGAPSSNLFVECTNPYLSAADSAELCENWGAQKIDIYTADDGYDYGRVITDPATGNLAWATVPVYSPYLDDEGNQVPLFQLSKAWSAAANSLGGEDVDNVDNRVLNLRVDGDFDLAERTFNYSLGVTDGTSRRVRGRSDIIKSRLFAAIDTVRLDDGTIVCRVETMSRSAYLQELLVNPYMQSAGTSTSSRFMLGDTGDCAPLNPFGDGSQISDAAKDYVGGLVTTRTTTRQNYNFGYLSGPIFSLPAGDMSLLLGYEERTESYQFRDSLIDEAFLASNSGGMTALKGKFSTSDVFSELIVPVISPEMNIPFVSELTIQAAYREMDHNISGKDDVDSFSIVYRMSDALGVRYNVQNTVRSPAIGEAFTPQYITSYIPNDPCDVSNINSGPAPDNRAANCAKQGITQPFLSRAETASINIYAGGNPNLLTEKSESYNYGILWTPSRVGIPFTDIGYDLKGTFRFALDYFEVELTDAIVSLTGNEVLSACYDADPNGFPNSFCNQVYRDADNQMKGFVPGSIGLLTGTSNGSTYDYEGYIVELDYSVDLADLFAWGQGTFAYNLKGYRESKDAFQATAASPVVDTTGAFSKPEDRFLHTVSWAKDRWYVFVDGTYTDGGLTDFYWNKDTQPNKWRNMDTGEVAPTSIDGYWGINGGVVYSITDQMTVQTYITNLTDEQCSGWVDCWLPGYRVPRTFKFGFRYQF